MVFEDCPSRARRIVKKGDIIISTVRTYLKAIAEITDDNDVVVSTGFAVIRAKNIFDKYLKYVLLNSYFVDTVASLSVGVSYPAINTSTMMNIKITIPTFDTQRRIADYLDHKTAAIDTLIADKQKMIELLKERRQAIISEAVTKGLDKNVNMKDSDIEWIGEIPEDWKLEKIKYMATQTNTLFLDGDWIESDNITENGIRYLTTGNVGNGCYKEQGCGFISEETFYNLNCLEVYPYDIMISRLNEPIGRACLVPDTYDKYIVAVDNVILRPNNYWDKRYIVYYMNLQNYNEAAKMLAAGTTMLRISRTNLSRLYVTKPPLDTQHRIADYLDKKATEIDNLITDITMQIEKLKEYRQAIISEAVTGKVEI